MVTNNSADYAPTQYNVIVGAASGQIASVAPSATSGVPLVSGGSSANPSFTTAVVAGGGTGLTSTTAYMPICGGTTTTGALQSVATGSAGQVLTYNSSSSLPTWQAAPAAGGMVLLAQKVGSGPTLTFDDTIITATYTNYFVTVSNENMSGQVNDQLGLQISSDNGVTYQSTSYSAGCTYTAYNAASFSNIHSSSYLLYAGPVQGNLGTSSLFFYLYDVTNANNPKLTGNALLGAGSNFAFVSGTYGGTFTTNNIQFSSVAGNTLTGTYTIYGLTN